MDIGSQLRDDVKKILHAAWTDRDGNKVPESEDVQLDGNDAVKLDGAVLYADLVESTSLVDDYKPWFAAEMYKSYLRCASKIISNEGGSITAYDGDRIMAVFIGDSKESDATRCALKINHAVSQIINPAVADRYSNKYVLKHAIGIDTSPLFVARTGIRGSNDLVWVGRSANYAAKLCSLRSYGGAVVITSDVYLKADASSTYGSGNQNMWTWDYWSDKKMNIYHSNWIWEP